MVIISVTILKTADLDAKLQWLFVNGSRASQSPQLGAQKSYLLLLVTLCRD
jgi:hypothetical protein